MCVCVCVFRSRNSFRLLPVKESDAVPLSSLRSRSPTVASRTPVIVASITISGRCCVASQRWRERGEACFTCRVSACISCFFCFVFSTRSDWPRKGQRSDSVCLSLTSRNLFCRWLWGRGARHTGGKFKPSVPVQSCQVGLFEAKNNTFVFVFFNRLASKYLELIKQFSLFKSVEVYVVKYKIWSFSK